MTDNIISAYLKYANLQMAAEALYGKSNNESFSITTSGGGTIASKDLTTGNKHASQFPSPLATSFLTEGWEILAHQPDTSTGFSATLFKNTNTKELVISFRSTEFVDDAVRDNQATNKLEIKEHGWALGQIADMEAWWEKLQANKDGQPSYKEKGNAPIFCAEIPRSPDAEEKSFMLHQAVNFALLREAACSN